MKELLDLAKSVANAEAKADAAHRRMDDLVIPMREDIKEMKAIVTKLVEKDNRRTGWMAGVVFMVTAAAELLKFFIHQKGG